MRIDLKLLTPADVTDRFVAWHKAPHTQYFSSTQRAFTKTDIIIDMQEGLDAGNMFSYGIFYLETDELIGLVKLGPISALHQTADMATLIGDEQYLGKGLAAEAIAAANKIAFEQHSIRKLYSGMYRQNISSVKAYLKAGWIIEGVLKNHFVDAGHEQDRILVACFNPQLYTGEYYTHGAFTFNQIYK